MDSKPLPPHTTHTYCTKASAWRLGFTLNFGVTHAQIHDTMEVKLAYAAMIWFKCLHWLQLAVPASGNTSLHKTGVFWWAEQQNSASETEKGRKKQKQSREQIRHFEVIFPVKQERGRENKKRNRGVISFCKDERMSSHFIHANGCWLPSEFWLISSSRAQIRTPIRSLDMEC